MIGYLLTFAGGMWFGVAVMAVLAASKTGGEA